MKDYLAEEVHIYFITHFHVPEWSIQNEGFPVITVMFFHLNAVRLLHNKPISNTWWAPEINKSPSKEMNVKDSLT
jgi:hypothetical protein